MRALYQVSVRDFDGIVFNDGVGQQLFAHVLNLGFGLGGVAFVQINLDLFTLANLVDAIEPERAKGVLNGLALRV